MKKVMSNYHHVIENWQCRKCNHIGDSMTFQKTRLARATMNGYVYKQTNECPKCGSKQVSPPPFSAIEK